MSEIEVATRQLVEEVETMMADLFFDRLTSLLKKKYPGRDRTFYEDIISESVARLLKAGRDGLLRVGSDGKTNPRGYITRIAFREAQRMLKQSAREYLPPPTDDGEDPWDAGLGAFMGNPTEDEAIYEMSYVYMRDLVEKWESRNLKTTVLVVLEAGYLGEPLSGVELADAVADALGEEVLEDTVRQWRKRGLDKLRAELEDDGYEITDEGGPNG